MCIYHAVPGLEQAHGEWLLVLFVLIKICIKFFWILLQIAQLKLFCYSYMIKFY